jgi:hypothetical protein
MTALTIRKRRIVSLFAYLAAVFFVVTSGLVYFAVLAIGEDVAGHHFEPLPFAIEAGIEEREEWGAPEPKFDDLCRKPLTGLRHYDGDADISPWDLQRIRSDFVATYESCIHPVRGGAGCAKWRFEDCYAIAIHEFLLEDPFVLKHFLEAMRRPCSYLHHSDLATFKRNYNLRFLNQSVDGGRPAWPDTETCAQYARTTYIVHVLDDDRRTVMTLRVSKKA